MITEERPQDRRPRSGPQPRAAREAEVAASADPVRLDRSAATPANRRTDCADRRPADVLFEALLVLPRQGHVGQAAPTRARHLLLGAEDGKNMTRRCDLTGHGQIGPNRTPRDENTSAATSATPLEAPSFPPQPTTARARADRCRGNRRVHAVAPGVRPDPRQGRPGRFPHHVALRPGQDELPGAGHSADLDEHTTSPPYGVHASPRATPGSRMRSATSVSIAVGAPSVSATVSGVITVKCFHRPSDARVELRPCTENPEHCAIVIDEHTDDREIVGVVVGAMVGTPRRDSPRR